MPPISLFVGLQLSIKSKAARESPDSSHFVPSGGGLRQPLAQHPNGQYPAMTPHPAAHTHPRLFAGAAKIPTGFLNSGENPSRNTDRIGNSSARRGTGDDIAQCGVLPAGAASTGDF